MNNTSPKTQTVKAMLARFPRATTKCLARKLYHENPLMFNSVEQARTVLRYWRGALGKSHREKISEEFVRPLKEAEAKRQNPFGLPESQADDWKPIKFPITKGRGVILPDLHIPYHDNDAITLALKWAKKEKYTDFVLLLGDIQDHYSLSRFQKDPRKRRYKEETEDVNKFLDVLEKQFPKAQIIYKLGNHEWRLHRYLQAKAPEIFDLTDFIWKMQLRIKERGIIPVDHDVYMRVGKLSIMHGHELNGASATVNPARGAYLKAHECVLMGHYHRSSTHSETSLNRRLDTAWSLGCLCCLWPEYARINRWNHGFAGLEVNGDDFEIENKRIVKGLVR